MSKIGTYSAGFGFIAIILLSFLLLGGLHDSRPPDNISPDIQSTTTGPQVEDTPDIGVLLNANEKFVYNVKYSFFTLGKIYVEILGDSLYRGRKTYHLKTSIESNPSIPFMGREINQYNSLMFVADSTPRTAVFWTDNVDEKIYNETRYVFDRDSGRVYTFEKESARDTLELEEPASSGHMLFYFARIFAGSPQPYRIPIYIDHEKGYLRAENSKKMDTREYEAFAKPIKTYLTTGHADVNGPFGFRGDFKAWFAADPLRIPVEAHVKVWLGNVKVRLIKYERGR